MASSIFKLKGAQRQYLTIIQGLQIFTYHTLTFVLFLLQFPYLFDLCKLRIFKYLPDLILAAITAIASIPELQNLLIATTDVVSG